MVPVSGATSFVTTVNILSDVEDSKAVKKLRARLYVNAATVPAPIAAAAVTSTPTAVVQHLVPSPSPS